MLITLLIFLLALSTLVGSLLIVFLPGRNRQLDSAFADVEKQAAILRASARKGEISEAECKRSLKGMMRLDSSEQWWMVGYETGQWYRYDGNDWLRADPPGRAALVNRKRGSAILLLVIGLVLGCGLGYGLFLWSGTVTLGGGQTAFIALESRNYVGFLLTALVFAGVPLGFASRARRLWWGQ